MVQGAKPRVVHDYGGEFVNRDVTAVVKAQSILARIQSNQRRASARRLPDVEP
jgi:hypothetical protein